MRAPSSTYAPPSTVRGDGICLGVSCPARGLGQEDGLREGEVTHEAGTPQMKGHTACY